MTDFNAINFTNSASVTWSAASCPLGGSITATAAGGGGNAAGFSAYCSANIASVTGDGTQYTVLFDTTTLDSASAFNTSTGVYTFPYTGLWLITGTLFIYNLNASHTQLYFDLDTTTGGHGLIIANPYAMSAVGSTELQINYSTMIQASATNTASLLVEVTGGTKSVGVGGGAGGMVFSGALINT